jgi:hypothetical protein
VTRARSRASGGSRAFDRDHRRSDHEESLQRQFKRLAGGFAPEPKLRAPGDDDAPDVRVVLQHLLRDVARERPPHDRNCVRQPDEVGERVA